MNKNNKLIRCLGLVALLLAALSACAAPQPAGLTDEQVSAVTDNVLEALNDNDYARFTQDFSQEMLAAFSEDQFTQLRDLLQTSSGNYLSIGAPTLSNAQGYVIYQFPCQFDREEVTVTITFKIGGDKVEGLFFTSPNLRSSGGQ
jgi:hypothetical protein